MFFKESVMKKMIKSAYKGEGLTVAHTPKNIRDAEGLYIATSTWAAWMEYDKVPKGIKAAVVEVAGDLPETGESYKATPGLGNQVTMSDATVLDLHEIVNNARNAGRITKIIQTGPINIRFIKMQNGEVLPISEELITVIDKNQTERDESEPEGPRMEENGYRMLWENERCIYLACILSDGSETQKEFRESLKQVVLP